MQKAPALFERVKALYDANRDKLRVVLTGSSALAIHDPTAETLAGRARLLALHPFTLSEGFAHARGEDPTADALAGIVSRLLCGRFSAEDFDQLVERARFDAAERRQWVEERRLLSLFPEPSPSREQEPWLREPRWLRGLDAFDADHRGLGIEIPYRVVFHFGEPLRPDERTFVLPVWALA